jgi:hypothetical protein
VLESWLEIETAIEGEEEAPTNPSGVLVGVTSYNHILKALDD